MNRFVNIGGKTINRDMIVSVETEIIPIKNDVFFSPALDESYQDIKVYKVINYGTMQVKEYFDTIIIRAKGRRRLIHEIVEIYKEEYEPKIIKKILEEIYEDK